jgi:CrcB protein
MAFIVVGLGGFIGSCLRHLINIIFVNLKINLPFGTLVSNVIAGILIGFFIGLDEQTNMLSPKTKLFLTTGFLGGLSTFSTFSLETVKLFYQGEYLLSALNVLLNVSLSILGVLLGLAVSKTIFKEV